MHKLGSQKKIQPSRLDSLNYYLKFEMPCFSQLSYLATSGS